MFIFLSMNILLARIWANILPSKDILPGFFYSNRDRILPHRKNRRFHRKKSKLEFILTLFDSELKLVVNSTMKSWDEKLHGSSFLKVQRPIIVNLLKIDHIEGKHIQIGAHKVTVSEPFKEQLLERMFG